MTIRENVFGTNGFDISQKLTQTEMDIITRAIQTQFSDRLTNLHPDRWQEIEALDLSMYHMCAGNIDHKKAWPKVNRILPLECTRDIKSMDFFHRLEAEFGPLRISNEEGKEEEETYWRIVRPESTSDIGPAHADAWFWECGHGETPEGLSRFKIWIPIVSEPGKNGLQVVPGSHLNDEYHYEPVMKDGFLKPNFIGDESQIGLELMPLNPGNMIIFNDKLIHKGALNRGKCTRISLEMTCFFRSDD